jgi:heptaprenyl diphosphate synthase
VDVSVNVADRLRLPALTDYLVQVEDALRAAVGSDDVFLTEVAGHLVNAGGKRIRPALVLAAAVAAGADPQEDTVAGGVAVELVHLGSLYHDDVIDEASSRRGTESVNHRWGNLVAILAGDFLLARASEIAASLGTEVAALLAQTICQLCEGEVGQLGDAFNTGREEASYLACISGKTASLMSTSARIGGLVSGAPRPVVDALTAYGRSFGMAFQIWDDVRDLVASEAELGKPAGHDMVEGTYTLPVIRALAVPGVGDRLRQVLGQPLDAEAREQARDLVCSTDAVAAALAEGRRWADLAVEALDPLRGNGSDQMVEALGGLGHHLVDSLFPALP